MKNKTMATMKLKKLQYALENIKTFKNPKIELEQYTTMPHLAACVLHTAQFVYGDIMGKCVADLGCGSGMLCIGAALLNAKYCAGFDIDPYATSLSVENASKHNLLNHCDFILCDMKNIYKFVQPKAFDTVIMNLPFEREHKVDLIVLNTAIKIANTAVYSIYKTSDREQIKIIAKQLGVYAKVVAELRFDLPESYKLHSQDSVGIQIDIVRFVLTAKPALHDGVSKSVL